MNISDNNIYNMDCLEGIKGVKSNSVKLIVADPPYFLGMTHNGQKGSFVDLAICRPFYEELFKQFNRVLVEGGEIFWFCDWRGYAFYFPVFDAICGAKNTLVWNKGFGRVNYCFNSSHEFLIFSVKGKTEAKYYEPNVIDCLGYSSRSDKQTDHPTEKPLNLIEKLVLEHSAENDLVLDPFTGSGTTDIAARRNNRRFIGFELDIENFSIIQNRFSKGVQQVLAV